MKRLLLVFALLSTAFLFSCGDDDEDTMDQPTGVTGTVNYDGQSYTISSGLFSLGSTGSDATGRFFLADGTITPNGSGTSVSSNDSAIIIGMIVVSRGSSTIDTGSYATSTNVPDQNVNFLSVSIIDGNSVDTEEAFTDGTVTINSSGNSTFSLTFDAPFRGTRLTGTVSGNFDSL